MQDQIPDFDIDSEYREERNNTRKKGRELSAEEEKEYQEGMALEEMIKTNTGWQIVAKWLDSFAHHTWADPRGTKDEKEWAWQELNAFHAANNARILLDDIRKAIARADYLGRVKRGEIVTKSFKI